MQSLVLDSESVVPFTITGDEGIYSSQCVIDRDGCGSEDLVVNRYRLFGGRANEGGVHPENDEAYYVLEGEATLILGDPGAGRPAVEYSLRPHMVAFIPAGTYHALRNESDRDFIILGIWPRQPKPGSNGIHDARIVDWGTSFRVSEAMPIGRRLPEDPGS